MAAVASIVGTERNRQTLPRICIRAKTGHDHLHHDFRRMPPGGQVIYLATTPLGPNDMFFSHSPAAARPTPVGVRLLPVALALAAALALAGCQKEGDAQAKETKGPDAVPVEVAKVARRPIAASYSGTAPLEAPAESQVVAKTSGVALQVLAAEGQHVRAGQVLVRLDPDRARLQAA